MLLESGGNESSLCRHYYIVSPLGDTFGQYNERTFAVLFFAERLMVDWGNDSRYLDFP